MKRILFVLEPGCDGVFNHVRDVVFYLHRHHAALQADLAYSSRRSGEELRQLVQRVRAQGGETLDLRISNTPTAHDLGALYRLVNLVRSRRPDLIHAHSSKAGALCRLSRWLVSGFPPVIYSPHAYFGMSGEKKIPARFFNAIESLLGPSAITVNCSEDEKAFAQKRLGLSASNLRIIHYGIDVQRFRPASAAEKVSLRNSLGVPADKRLLITIGRDSYQKNYDQLYAALPDALQRTELFFAHAGAGSTARMATLGRPGSSRAFEHLSDPAQLLRAADGFILTSRYEGLSIAALEALVSGMKLFLSRVPGLMCLQELGFDEITWLDPADMNRSIVSSLAEWAAQPGPPELEDQICRGRELFNDQIQFRKLVDLYETLVAKS